MKGHIYSDIRQAAISKVAGCRRGVLTGCVVLGVALALAGCKTTGTAPAGGTPGSAITTGSVSPVPETAPPSMREMLRLQQAWKKRPGDATIGLSLARSLAALGQRTQQLEVLRKVVEYNPRRQDIRYRYGIALLKANRAVQAEQQFRRLLREGRRDWRTLNALGSALAEQNRHEEARQHYRMALRQSPGNPQVVNNMAMSHIMQGNPKEAERLLRAALPNARGAVKKKLRQNLALALGLQGRFEEARYMASHDLPPAEVEANMAWLRRMLGAGQTWQRPAGRNGGA